MFANLCPHTSRPEALSLEVLAELTARCGFGGVDFPAGRSTPRRRRGRRPSFCVSEDQSALAPLFVHLQDQGEVRVETYVAR